MGEKRGTKGLELWCKKMTEGYPGVKIENMTTSWRDGLAFCAIIHHFRPELIDFSKLNKDDVYRNNELAFRVAEQYLGIPALLEAEDMVEYPVPDRLSILTYLSQFYQVFAVSQGSPSRMVPKRPAAVPDRGIVSPASTSPPTKMAIRSSNAGVTFGIPRREPCAKCGLPVFIAERLNIGKQLFHRTCFQCARCKNQLTLDNYYELESGNQFCCETCPDEEHETEQALTDKSVLSRSLSDEEKSASLKMNDSISSSDNKSKLYKTAVDFSTPDSEYNSARSQFINTLLNDSETEKVPPDLPKSKPPNLEGRNVGDPNTNILESYDSGLQSIDLSVNSRSVKIDSDSKQTGEESEKNIVTKENVQENTSLVQARMRLFEDNTTQSSVPSERIEIANSLLKPVEDLVQEKPLPSTENNEDNSNSIIIISDDSLLTTDSKSEISQNLSQDDFIQNDSKDDIIIISNSKGDTPLEHEISQNLSHDDIIQNVSKDDTHLTHEEEKEVDKVNSASNTKQTLASILNESVENKKEIDENNKNVLSDTKDVKVTQEEYPDDLNPFDDEEEEVEVKISKSLNPFGSDEEDEEVESKKKITPQISDYNLTSGSTGCTPDYMKTTVMKRISVNPYAPEEIPTPPVRRVIPAPKFSLNPFSDDEDDDYEDRKPTAAPRESIRSNTSSLNHISSNFGSMNSISSGNSSIHSTRKKKPAPKPPIPFDAKDSPQHSQTSSPSTSVHHSPKPRKSKKAPPPPPSTSTPILTNHEADVILQSPIPVEGSTLKNKETNHNFLSPTNSIESGEFEKEKIVKDELNRNRQSQSIPDTDVDELKSFQRNKSTYGKWKRKKGLAPSRPIPQKRTIKALPIIEVRRELDIIEVQLQGLEKQGVRLEQIIREHCEGPNSDPDTSVSIEAEDLILQLFEVVNEKNEICRRQSELMYLQRQHRLEVEHAEVEYQIRCLMLQPEANKTDFDKAKEEELVKRLVEIVEKRNEIVECLEMDRVRETEEDDSICNSMNTYALKRDEQSVSEVEDSPMKKEKKKLKKLKFKPKFKSAPKVDVDKDVDESESSTNSSVSSKGKKKKKFNLF